MALALGSRVERRNPQMEKVSKILERMTGGAEAMNSGRRSRSAAVTRRYDEEGTEWEKYHEQQLWGKLKTERHKDLVLMSDDRDDVRIYYRAKGVDPKKKKNLEPIHLDEEYYDSIKPAAHALSMGSSHPVTHARTQQSTMHRGRLEDLMKRRESELIALGVTAPGEAEGLHTKRGEGEEVPTEFTHAQWVEMIRGINPNALHQRRQKKHERKRVRHHRLSCKFHPYSTSSEFRRMSLATAFPHGALRTSLSRVQHAANGASSGMSDPVPVAFYFEEPVLVESTSRPASGVVKPVAGANIQSKSSSRRASSASSVKTAEGEREKERSEPSPIPTELEESSTIGAEPESPLTPQQQAPHLKEEQGESTAGGFLPQSRKPTIAGTGDDGTFFMTQPRTMAERCSTPSLTQFEQPPRPHSLPGEFQDCECTPRSTDDELSDDEDYPMVSAGHAQRKLSMWRRQFHLSTIRGLCTLNSVLKEREEQRDLAVTEREHLDVVTDEAENAGADWVVSRRIRSTTPLHSTVWAPVFQAIGDHEKLIARNRDLYVALCDKSALEFEFPSNQRELEFFQMLRERCVHCSELQPPAARPQSASSRLRSRAHTPSVGVRGSSTTPGGGSTNTLAGGSRPSRAALRKQPSSRQQLRPLNVESFGSDPTSTNSGGGGYLPTPSFAGRPSSISFRRTDTPSASGHDMSMTLDMSMTGVWPSLLEKTPSTVRDLPVPEDSFPLTEDFFVLTLEKFGGYFVAFRTGVLFLDKLRELCGVPSKPFFLMVHRHVEQGEWKPHHELSMLQKRVNAGRGGGAGGGGVSPATAGPPISNTSFGSTSLQDGLDRDPLSRSGGMGRKLSKTPALSAGAVARAMLQGAPKRKSVTRRKPSTTTGL